jgi:hypothetical protein
MRRARQLILMSGVAVLLILGLTVAATAQEHWQWPEHPMNLKVLPKDTHAEQLRETMGMFVRGLGVRCTFCHVGKEGEPLSSYEFPSDEKANKNRAREMLRMVHSINERLQTIDFGEGERVTVTCATCHRGRPRPTTMVEELREAYTKSGASGAIAHFNELRDRFYARGTLDFTERPLNTFGYELLGKDDVEGAIAVLRFNAQEFPESGNVWDSLAEAYLKAGRTEQSAIYYRKSLELNPDNRNALKQLQKIEVKGEGRLVGDE